MMHEKLFSRLCQKQNDLAGKREFSEVGTVEQFRPYSTILHTYFQANHLTDSFQTDRIYYSSGIKCPSQEIPNAKMSKNAVFLRSDEGGRHKTNILGLAVWSPGATNKI